VIHHSHVIDNLDPFICEKQKTMMSRPVERKSMGVGDVTVIVDAGVGNACDKEEIKRSV